MKKFLLVFVILCGVVGWGDGNTPPTNPADAAGGADTASADTSSSTDGDSKPSEEELQARQALNDAISQLDPSQPDTVKRVVDAIEKLGLDKAGDALSGLTGNLLAQDAVFKALAERSDAVRDARKAGDFLALNRIVADLEQKKKGTPEDASAQRALLDSQLGLVRGEAGIGRLFSEKRDEAFRDAQRSNLSPSAAMAKLSSLNGGDTIAEAQRAGLEDYLRSKKPETFEARATAKADEGRALGEQGKVDGATKANEEAAQLRADAAALRTFASTNTPEKRAAERSSIQSTLTDAQREIERLNRELNPKGYTLNPQNEAAYRTQLANAQIDARRASDSLRILDAREASDFLKKYPPAASPSQASEQVVPAPAAAAVERNGADPLVAREIAERGVMVLPDGTLIRPSDRAGLYWIGRGTYNDSFKYVPADALTQVTTADGKTTYTLDRSAGVSFDSISARGRYNVTFEAGKNRYSVVNGQVWLANYNQAMRPLSSEEVSVLRGQGGQASTTPVTATVAGGASTPADTGRQAPRLTPWQERLLQGIGTPAAQVGPARVPAAAPTRVPTQQPVVRRDTPYIVPQFDFSSQQVIDAGGLTPCQLQGTCPNRSRGSGW